MKKELTNEMNENSLTAAPHLTTTPPRLSTHLLHLPQTTPMRTRTYRAVHSHLHQGPGHELKYRIPKLVVTREKFTGGEGRRFYNRPCFFPSPFTAALDTSLHITTHNSHQSQIQIQAKMVSSILLTPQTPNLYSQASVVTIASYC
jgi:hypothetical protein